MRPACRIVYGYALGDTPMRTPIRIALAASLMIAVAQAEPEAEPEPEPVTESEAEPVGEAEGVAEPDAQEPMEEIVVEGQQTRAPGEARYWTVMPDPGGRNRMSVIVGVEERRDPILARQIEEFGPPPLVLEAAIARICMSARRPGSAVANPRPRVRAMDKWQAVRTMKPPRTRREAENEFVWGQYDCTGKRLSDAEAIKAKWSLTEDQVKRFEALERDYRAALAAFAVEMDMPPPPPESLETLLSEGDNPAKQFVLSAAGWANDGRRR